MVRLAARRSQGNGTYGPLWARGADEAGAGAPQSRWPRWTHLRSTDETLRRARRVEENLQLMVQSGSCTSSARLFLPSSLQAARGEGFGALVALPTLLSGADPHEWTLTLVLGGRTQLRATPDGYLADDLCE